MEGSAVRGERFPQLRQMRCCTNVWSGRAGQEVSSTQADAVLHQCMVRPCGARGFVNSGRCGLASMYGPAVRGKRFRQLRQMRSCINVWSGRVEQEVSSIKADDVLHICMVRPYG